MTTLGYSSEQVSGFGSWWRALTLAQQFVLMGGTVVLAGMLVIGTWVARQIEEGVTRNAAYGTALYVDSFISPLTSELEHVDKLSIGPIRALDEVFKDSPVSNRLLSVKVWKADGTIVYGTDYNLIGQKFPPTEELIRASGGEVAATFDDLEDDENANEREFGIPILEIYSPVRAAWSGKIIAVVEFYEDGTELKKTLAEARRKSWFVVAAVMAAIAGLLMTIVYRGSRTIDQQKSTLSLQLAKVTATSEQNRSLRRRVQQASERVAELNEGFLKRTSAELHDGPAQLLSFAALRLGEARRIRNKKARDEEFDVIQTALEDAMLDIRNVCRGLSLPDIEKLSVQQIINRVTQSHIDRTQAEVAVNTPSADISAPTATKICIYRFVQEALNNAWKHARENTVSVSCELDPKTSLLRVSVSDDGPGFEIATVQNNIDKMGLGGMRERVRSIGGELLIDSAPGSGTSLVLEVNLSAEAGSTEGGS